MTTIVALTGSIGSGKSTVANIFKRLGAEIIDADSLAREAVKKGSRGLADIKRVFGEEVLQSDGSLDRKKMAEIVFNDKTKKKLLEKIVHPRVRELYNIELQSKKSKGAKLIIYVVPLFFEAKLDRSQFDKVIVVFADNDIALERIVARDGISYDLAKKKLSSQMPIEEKERLADIVIYNNGDIASLEKQVKLIFKDIMNEN